MDILEAIYTRQSIGKICPDAVPQALIEKVLAAAAQAPNHYKVRPWQFIVLQGDARRRLGNVFAQILRENHPELDENAYQKEARKPLRAPVIISVAVRLPATPREDLIENIAAASAATQNILLAAHALGLAAKWRTGTPARAPRVKTFLGLDADQPLIAFVYLGYPAKQPLPVSRPSFEDRTTWLS